MTAASIRLRLSRRKGFDLQAESLAANGLPAVSVARPHKFGNPFTVAPQHPPGSSWSRDQTIMVPTVEDAVACFEGMMATEGEPGTRAYALCAALPELRGHNLACWCRLDAPCHADVLLRLANDR